MRYAWRVQTETACDREMWELDFRQAPAEVEYRFQLAHDAGDKAPDAVEYGTEGTLDAVQDSADRALDRVEGGADSGFHRVHGIHHSGLDAVPDGSCYGFHGIENR